MKHQIKLSQKQIIKLLAIVLIVACSLYYFFQQRDSEIRPSSEECLHQQEFSRGYSVLTPHIVHVSRQISTLPVFFSFSQFHEDVILYHIFQGVQKGFYVDIGAHHPTLISDTKIFYEMGWSGINVEPLEYGCNELKKQRLRDINLCVACGAESGNMTLHENGVFTTLKDDVVAAETNIKFTNRTVSVVRISEILSSYCTENPVIHFMKVDVEGFEKEVLQGMDFVRFKPQVLVLEAIEPGTRVKSYLEWEPILSEHGYEFLYEFKLNRYYIHQDFPALKATFRTIPEIEKRFNLVILR